jgi:acyl carrier protein
LPRVPSGKIDRQSLPAAGHAARPSQEQTAEPRTKTEQTVARIWEEFLGLNGIGVGENFFDLGGHSLMMVRIRSRLRETLKTELRIVDMFRYPTIRALAQFLQEQETSAPTT